MKKLINSPDSVVTDALAGVAAAHPSLAVDIEHKVITRAGGPQAGKVALVSGGGSGHEPLHGGFVGYGMLDAACPGEVFTSPVPDQMLAATKAVNGGAGVLHIVKNYTGDVLNFQMAAELAGDEGIEVVSVVTNDDVAVQDSLYTAGPPGRRRHRLRGEDRRRAGRGGAGLDKVADVAREVNERSRSLGVALTSCTVPAAGKPTFELTESEIEMGIGIHGEPGRSRGPAEHRRASSPPPCWMRSTPTCRCPATCWSWSTAWAARRCSSSTSSSTRCGSTWKAKGARIARNLVGNYITSLEMQGFSVTVCRLTDTLTRLWDAPVDTPALRWGR